MLLRIKIVEPNSEEYITSWLVFPPINLLIICGTIMPKNPIIPAIETQ